MCVSGYNDCEAPRQSAARQPPAFHLEGADFGAGLYPPLQEIGGLSLPAVGKRRPHGAARAGGLVDPQHETVAVYVDRMAPADIRGSMQTFRDYLKAFAADRDLSRRKLLVFRYPNNASLGRCGQFLDNEMRRVVVAPEKAFFVCHSAGGLVFRWYAETRKQPFDRAILLATPHEGTSVTSLKYLADVDAFFGELKMNGPGALARMLPEGEGQVVYDVHENSLFLRYLGRNADLAKRYHVFSGDFLRPGQVLALEVGLTAGKRVLMNRVLPRIDSAVLRRQVQRRIERLHVPIELSEGDLIVSVQSALLKDAGHSTRTALNHEQFTKDEKMIEDAMESIRKK